MQPMSLALAVVNLFMTIIFLTVMHLPKYLFSAQKNPLDVLITVAKERAGASIKQLNGLVSKIGQMARLVCTENPMKAPRNGRQQSMEVNI